MNCELRHADEGVVEAAYKWYTILQQADSPPLLAGEEPEPAIVQRHWAISYWEMMRNRPELMGMLQIIPAPRLATERAPEGRQTASIIGDWFLGIIRGSPNPSRGMWAIKALTSEAMNRQMQQNKLWLPAHRSLLSRGEDQKLREMYQHSVSRREIPNYQQVRLILIEGLRSIYTKSGLGVAEIREILVDMNERMKLLQN